MKNDEDADDICIWCSKPCHSNNKYEESFCSMRCVHEYMEKGHDVTKKSCFVATAACQSCDHPVVVDLRNFRDQYLTNNQYGRKFIMFYYKYGPKMANVLKNNFTRIFVLKFIIKPIHFIIKFFPISK